MVAGTPGSAGGSSLSIEQLAQLREKTTAVSDLLRERLSGHLSTLQVALSPRWLLGKHTRVGARDDIPGADRNVEALREAYGQHYGKPFLLPKELPEGPISIDGRLELHPWEYTQVVGEGEDAKHITLTSPVRWVVNYRAGYTLAQLRRAILTKESLRHEDAQQFVVNAIALRMLLEKNEGLVRLLRDLRYEVAFEPCDGLGELPMVTIAAPLQSFKPEDSLIASATSFSGVLAFIELLDVQAARKLEDPLREQIASVLA